MNNETGKILEELKEVKEVLKQEQNNNVEILKDLKNVKEELENIKKENGKSYLPSITFFLLSVGMSLVLFASNLLYRNLDQQWIIPAVVAFYFGGIAFMFIPYLASLSWCKKQK